MHIRPALVGLFLGTLALGTNASAGPQERILYSFQGGTDGSLPAASLIADTTGALYGTTLDGGVPNCIAHYGGCGTVFKLTPGASGYTKTTIYSFQDSSGGYGPVAGLIADREGNLYGTTEFGGDSVCHDGCGTVFKLTRTASGYSEKLLYRFQGGADGAGPVGKLMIDRSGALYGAAANGGVSAPTCLPSGCGTIYALTPGHRRYAFHVLYAFSGGADGGVPASGLIADGSGLLYGTTRRGGNSNCAGPSGSAGCGVVFQLSSAGSHFVETALYAFQGGSDGGVPAGALVADAGGNLFGSTQVGGDISCRNADASIRNRPDTFGPYGCGTVYELEPSASGYRESTLHAFNGAAFLPNDSLLVGRRNVLFGTTLAGENGGTVFELAAHQSGYVQTLLHSFQGNGDGLLPAAALLEVSGVFFGTTLNGGGYGLGCEEAGCGTVFALTP